MDTRISEHPILGKKENGKEISFFYDGKEMKGYEGEPIAAALKAAGVMVHRYTKKEHKPRGIFCAIGRCTDCVMIVATFVADRYDGLRMLNKIIVTNNAISVLHSLRYFR